MQRIDALEGGSERLRRGQIAGHGLDAVGELRPPRIAAQRADVVTALGELLDDLAAGWWPNLPRSDSHEGGKAGRSLIFSSHLPAFMFNSGHHPRPTVPVAPVTRIFMEFFPCKCKRRRCSGGLSMVGFDGSKRLFSARSG
ncbi:hypothetical protein WME74_16420 [Sorangium sp. So ce341]